MKKLMMILAVAIASIAMTSCAEKKTFKKADGTEFTAKPYGWMDKEKEIDGVEYDICTGNVVLSILFCETVAAPVLLTGLELWEPISFTDPSRAITIQPNDPALPGRGIHDAADGE